ncbi:hypothetical protein CYMTET_35993, partial [Cymbomonas tetramitiformis]
MSNIGTLRYKLLGAIFLAFILQVCLHVVRRTSLSSAAFDQPTSPSGSSSRWITESSEGFLSVADFLLAEITVKDAIAFEKHGFVSTHNVTSKA